MVTKSASMKSPRTRFLLVQLVDGSRLPCLQTSKHFVNLTNGLELVPMLQQLQLPFR